MKFHPASETFPVMEPKRFAELKEDIAVHGLREAITICDGMILDGRNRYKACRELQIEPKQQHFDGDPWAYAWSLNGQRRDLVAEQRYLIWKKCSENSEAFQAEKRKIQEEANQKRSTATKEQHAISSPRYGETMVVGQSVQLPKEAKERQSKVKASNTNAGAVARGDKLYKERPDLAEKVMQGEIRPVEAHRAMKREEHLKKIEKAKSDPIPPDEESELILADPPWQYDHQQAENRAIENQYLTATLEEIKKHKPRAAKNAILFLWATAPKLVEALEVMEAWGFNYKTCAVWDKQIIGMGYWFRGQHELLLVGTKGNPGTVPECARESSIFSEKRGKHSKKPECVYEWIETAFPDKTKLEMYCRVPRKSWTAWGNEI